MNNHITTPNSPELQLCPASPDPHQRTLHSDHVSTSFNIQPITTIRPHHGHNPTKKRTKMIRFHSSGGSGPSTSHSGVVTKKKPDPSAPKITRPCTECGKRFWSWKALFGHMRCHPERPWRGINPPPNIHHHHPPPDHDDFNCVTTEEDEYVAACLLMLANTNTTTTTNTHASTSSYQHQYCTPQDTLPVQINEPETRFECLSCKKVFGSHQALGGHRASHKNVKGCFAITRNEYAGPEELECGDDHTSHCDRNGVVFGMINQQHKCSICFKTFSTGQALGGHKRCHLEKEDSVVPTASTSVLSQPFRFDLNIPAPVQDNFTCSSSDLDLILHL